MRWLVTGGVGFIGSHVTREMLARGDDVTIVDDFSDAPYPRAEKERNERDLLAEFPKLEVVRGCVTDRAAMEPLVRGRHGVLHLAGLAGVRPSFRDPARYARVNVEGTATMLQLANEHGCKRFVFASSSSVYGNSTPLPAREDSPCIEPESPYAASKRSAELVTLAMSRVMPQLPITALRFFTVYGPRQRPEMAITLWMRAVLAGKPITLFGDGSMRRDFTHASDIARGVLAALERAPAGFRAYNLGSGAPVTLKELITGIERVAGKKATIVSAGVPAGDVDATFADISRPKDELGWSPRVALADGLVSVRDWVEAHP